MPKSKKMKNMNTTALPKLGREDNSDPIRRFMLGKAFIDLRGLKTLSVRRDFIPEEPPPSDPASEDYMNSSIAETTTIKSSQFHVSLK